MKKKLSLNQLHVKSFITRTEGDAGTVKGGGIFTQYSFTQFICEDPNSNNTCASNCGPCGGTNNTCAATCNQTNNQACPSFTQFICEGTNDPFLCE